MTQGHEVRPDRGRYVLQDFRRTVAQVPRTDLGKSTPARGS
jgi:hypothetical protein